MHVPGTINTHELLAALANGHEGTLAARGNSGGHPWLSEVGVQGVGNCPSEDAGCIRCVSVDPTFAPRNRRQLHLDSPPPP